MNPLLLAPTALLFIACLPDSATAQAAAGPAAQRVELADTRMASTPSARQTLKYLASCALGPQTLLVAEHDGHRYEFPGGLGLAPDWQDRALTPEEQRWVSACMLARTNAFGVKVLISMRSDFPSRAPGLQTWQEEDAAYTLEEATFFGNLFDERPQSYVCGPAHDDAEERSLLAQRRICSLRQALPGEQEGDPAPTVCGLVHVGRCTAQALQQGGVTYRQAITVFLPPQPAPPASAP